jgi:3-methylcrotonyl-CoA carboxylase alpha subunit
MKRLLIANRGEIAVRIMRACREAGISPVAVFSEADRTARHVSLADLACCIGPGPAKESYLRIDNILEAAVAMQADAIHPGYGFLSENAGFAAACAATGITFVGPPADVIRLLGDKIEAKRLMERADVPVVPGYNGDDQSDRLLRRQAQQIGLPLLIKAAAGGGGRGMRVVTQAEQLEESLQEARREAKAAFGDDRLLLERYIEKARHIEVQIFGDIQGEAIHLYERECSIQRRHQKIIEESPSPALTPELRERITAAAVRVCRAAGYVNAGTVEFLLEESPDGEHRFYFLEVNTRLQVEHPVTELLTGLDLVRLQFRIADGEPLPYRQEQIIASGHAMEVRIYAEDAAANYQPSIGRLAQWIEPSGPGVRVDSGVVRGSEVTPYYDPMLAKLIVRGQDRAATLSRMEQALMGFHALGVRTNIPYLLDIVRHPAFRAGELSTRFLEQHFSGWRANAALPPAVLLALAAEAVTAGSQRPSAAIGKAEAATTPWHSANGWRNA